MTCYIFGAAACKTAMPHICDEDLVIAADGGLVHLERGRVTPDIIIGDFDSLGHLPSGTEVIRLPVEKDVTDTAAAIDVARGRGYRRFVLYGATGGRPDHTMANYQTLASLALRGEEGYLVGEDFSATAIYSGSSLIFNNDFQGTFSVFAIGGDARGVSIRGGTYALDNATLSPVVPLGVSNSFAGEELRVSVREGTLLVMWEGEKLPAKK